MEDSKFVAKDHEDGKPPEREEVEAMQKNRVEYLFFTSQSRFLQIHSLGTCSITL